ncbi:hypothetical protein B0H11DRAFT_2332895 [Mycena galericulata]|nr:hypothetical protein B0H11DRAFT_2332895 [Mycena galericulata]
MSTGSKPPKPQVKIVDDEAEEASQDEEDEDEYESSFIDDHEVDAESPSPERRPETLDAPSTPRNNKERGSTPPLLTRSRAAKATGSPSERSDQTSDTMPSKKRLDTMGHSLSRIFKGVKTPAVEKAPGDTMQQTQLTLQSSGSKQASRIDPSSIDPALFAAFLEYQQGVALPSISKEQETRPSNARRVGFREPEFETAATVHDLSDAEGSPPPKPAGRRTRANMSSNARKSSDANQDKAVNVKGKAKAVDPISSSKASVSGEHTVAPKDVAAAFKAVSHSSTQKRKGKAGADKGSSSGSKRMRDAHSDNDTEVPASVVAAFAAISSSPSPKKKSKTAAVLHTENIKTVKKIPDKCKVFDKTLQDPLLFTVYLSLPPLFTGIFRTWSSTPSPGNFLLSKWAEHCPEIDINSLWACVNFVQRLHYINPSRRTALGVQAISQVYREEKRWTLSVDRKTAVCISVGMAIKSALLEPSTVTTPAAKSRWSKFLTCILHAQDFERLVAFVCMAFHVDSLDAQIPCDAITFGTRSFSKEKPVPVRAKFSQGVPSSATRTSTTRTYASDDALHWEDEIPIYDGRNVVLDFTNNIDDLENILPRFEGNQSEVPNESCVAIAYTVSQFKTNVNFNIRFVVVIATPTDDDDGSAGEMEEGGYDKEDV